MKIKRQQWYMIGMLLVGAILAYAIITQPFDNSPLLFKELAIYTGPGYYYRWDIVGKTEDAYREATNLGDTSFESNKGAIATEVANQIRNNLAGELKTALEDAGYSVQILSAVITNVRVETKSGTYQYYAVFHHTIHVSVTVEFKTNKPVSPNTQVSPSSISELSTAKQGTVSLATLVIDPATIALAALVVKYIIIPLIITATVAVTIYVAITTVAESFTAYTNEMVEEYYDEDGNLIKRVTKREEGTDWGEILPQITIILAATAGAVFLGQIYLKSRKKES